MLKKLLSTQSNFIMSFAMLGIRVPLGLSMVLAGQGKIMNLPNFIHYCDNLGIPPAFAVIGACGEFFGGLGVLLGGLSRIAAFGTGCAMATAAVVRHLLPGYGYGMNWHGGAAFGSEGYAFHTLIVGMSVAIMFVGAGVFSMDYVLYRLLSRNRKRALIDETQLAGAHGD